MILKRICLKGLGKVISLKKGVVTKISVGLLIVLSWIGMMILLIEKEGLITGDLPKDSIRAIIPATTYLDTWKGIYIDNRWVGYHHSILAPTEKGYRLNSKSYLRFKMFNQLNSLSLLTIQELDSEYRLINFKTRISGVSEITLSGRRLDDQLIVEIHYGDTTYKKTFPAEDDIFLDQSILQIYRGKGLKVGDSYALSILNPLTLKTEKIEIRAVGRDGASLVMETQFAGLVSRSWIDKDGRVIREETPNGWVIKREDRTTIERYLASTEGDAVDILRDSSVLISKKVHNPRDINFMKIRVAGVDLKNFSFDGTRQKVIDPARGIIEISSIGPPSEEIAQFALHGDTLAPFLKTSVWVDSDNPFIRSMSEKIVGEEPNRWRAATMIGNWVYENVEKVFISEIPVASSILKNRKGDCNEHTVLFIALARAQGIPAEMCSGLVYLNDGFYYHAWPKVFVGRWVHLDPTLGQSVADATHFELVSGDFSSQAKIALAIGKITIEIVESDD
jgi:transglutaminase-like putative cysteine protease